MAGAKGRRVAIVTGGNRGIGREVARQLAGRGLTVVLTSRDEGAGHRAAAEINGGLDGARVFAVQLDVSDAQSVDRFLSRLVEEFGAVDVLVNNAGVYPDEGVPGLKVAPGVVLSTFVTNALGPLRLCQGLMPGMVERGYGRVVNVSSGYGQMSSMGAGVFAYRASKAALNMLTIVLADEARGGRDVLVNAADPGWVRTRMGGSRAPRTVEEGADTLVWLATLPRGGPTGGFFHDRQPIAW